MTDTMQTDDTTLEPTGTDIRVFGKWSGVEIQITDMSLEVCLNKTFVFI
jgi:small subunit ribosomal protein S5e